MSQTSTLKGQCIAEFLGTGLLIFFGVGCVAALKVAGATFGQWEISIIWGLGVAMAIYLTAGVSGAHGSEEAGRGEVRIRGMLARIPRHVECRCSVQLRSAAQQRAHTVFCSGSI